MRKLAGNGVGWISQVFEFFYRNCILFLRLIRVKSCLNSLQKRIFCFGGGGGLPRAVPGIICDARRTCFNSMALSAASGHGMLYQNARV